jgi:hypothetical protein
VLARDWLDGWCARGNWSLGLTISGHRHRPWCRRYPTSDIDISYSDIGTKNVGLNPFIPVSE